MTMNSGMNHRMLTRSNPLRSGVLALLCLLSSAPLASAQYQYELLKTFDGGSEGRSPSALIVGSDGDLYGTSYGGGLDEAGTVFKVGRDGSGFTVLHHFELSPSDGAHPTPLLLEASDGLLYGATDRGGTNGYGTLFRLDHDGSGHTNLHHFAASFSPGALLEGSDGALYGTTFSYSDIESGTIFKIQKDGSRFVVLHRFDRSPDEGIQPGPLLESRDGALYGLTWGFGCSGTNCWSGTLFRIERDGSDHRVLRRFGEELEEKGLGPELLEGSDGALYGTAAGEAIRLRDAILFKLHKDGSGFSIVLRDCGAYGKVIELANGTLCIPNNFRGVCGFKVLAVNPDGTGFNTLQRFEVQQGPPNCLVEGLDGSLYGTTETLGELWFGSVFALRSQPVLSPPLLSGGAVTFRFTSRPYSTNQIQRTRSLGDNWITLINLAVDATGVGEFSDPAAPGSNAFYRVVCPRFQ